MSSIKHPLTFLAALLSVLAAPASTNATPAGATTLPSHLNSECDEYFPVGDPSKPGNGESRTQNILGMFDHRVGKYFNDSTYKAGYPGSGLLFYPRAGWTVLQELYLTAASDAPGRDPSSVTVEGTKDGGRTFEPIARDLPIPQFQARKSRRSAKPNARSRKPASITRSARSHFRPSARPSPPANPKDSPNCYSAKNTASC